MSLFFKSKKKLAKSLNKLIEQKIEELSGDDSSWLESQIETYALALANEASKYAYWSVYRYTKSEELSRAVSEGVLGGIKSDIEWPDGGPGLDCETFEFFNENKGKLSNDAILKSCQKEFEAEPEEDKKEYDPYYQHLSGYHWVKK